MKKPTNKAYMEQLRALAGDSQAQSYLRRDMADPADLDDLEHQMVVWLASLCLLYGVPFNLLVSDERLLPRESIRFFYIDQNWTDSMADGAMSIAIHSSRDTGLQAAIKDLIQQAYDYETQLVRARLFNSGATAGAGGVGTLSGFLLRSELVSGWPGLEVRAYQDTGGQQPMPLLRMDHLAPDVLLCIFNGIPGQVQISEPAEGLRFGVYLGSSNQLLAAPRNLGVPDPTRVGQQLSTDQNDWAAAPWRGDPSDRVLDIRQLNQNLAAALTTFGQFPTQPASLTPAQFGLQMVKTPEQITYTGAAGLPQLAQTELRIAGESYDPDAVFAHLFRS